MADHLQLWLEELEQHRIHLYVITYSLCHLQGDNRLAIKQAILDSSRQSDSVV